MSVTLDLVRWFNYACPWHQWKPSLAKRATRRLAIPQEPQVYGGIQGGLKMRLDLSSYFERWIYLNTYEIATLALLRRLLRPGDVYVDAGANLGLLTLVASRAVGKAGKVYAFEPWPATLERLRENLSLNDTANVTLVTKGCWHKASTAELHEFTDGHIGETSMGHVPDKSLGKTITIHTTRIDDVVSERVKVIKLDIEGAERGALQGAERTLFSPSPAERPHIVIELNPRACRGFNYQPLEIVDWLLQHTPNYRLHRIKSKRTLRTTRDALAAAWQNDPDRTYNVWLEPR